MQIFCVILVTSSSSESHFRWLRHCDIHFSRQYGATGT